MCPKDKKATHNVKPYGTREWRASTRRECPLLWARRWVTLCNAQGVVSSLQGGGGDSDFSEADRDAMEARADFWSAPREKCRHHVMPREQLYVSTEPSFPIPLKYIDVVRQTKTTMDNLEESNIDDLWNIDGHRIL